MNESLPGKLQLAFTWIDYSLFSSVLVLSVAIGIYFGCFGGKPKTKIEYLLGGKTMKVLPVAASLIASDISGMSLLAVPADIYKYGATYAWGCLAILLASVITCYVFLPVFYKLQLTSSYEYFKLRFDGRVRMLASFLFSFSMLLYNPIVIYLPALALSQGTGINVHLTSVIICVICIFYTTIGGLKAVIWTDTLQMVIMLGSMTFIFVLGILSVGGISNIIDISSKGHRLDILEFNIDPTVRDGICALVIGTLAKSLSFRGVTQSNMQRYLAVPSITDARKAIAIFVVGVSVIKLICVATGLIIFTKYANCDPLSSGVVPHSDQILPYYVMDVAGHIPGLPGLFIAGIFSASLSTLSASLNTFSATICEDFILPLAPSFATEKRINIALRATTIIMGVICTLLVLLIEKMGSILPLSNSVIAINGGPLMGLFILGIIFPVANSKGALCGAISGVAFISWVIIGNQWYKRQHYYVDPVKPFFTSDCNGQANITSTIDTTAELPFYLYRVTFWYYNLMGITVTVIVGLIVSCCTKDKSHSVDPDLLTPFNFNIFKIGNKSQKLQNVPLNKKENKMVCDT